MVAEPPLVRRQPNRPRLPFLGLKRAHSNSWGETQPDRKRQFFGDIPYDEIVDGVLRGLGPPLYVCEDMRKQEYKRAFRGRTHDGTLDGNMEVNIWAQLRNNGPARIFSLGIVVSDSQGPLRIWPLLEAEGLPVRVTISCGFTVPELRAELLQILTPWLDFVDRHFSLAQEAGPIAPGQAA